MADRLDRFVWAQDNGVYQQALREISSGRKSSHWIWYIFPQIAGLGRSARSRTYAIRNRAEAEAYLTHPLLGPRLQECTTALLAVENRSAFMIFGGIDATKVKSSMTLFAHVSDESIFPAVLTKYYAGQADQATLAQLSSALS